MSPVVLALRQRGVQHRVFYTNQHVAAEMSDVFFSTLGYLPDWRPESPFRPGLLLDLLIHQFRELGVTDVVVQGDTTSTLVGALAGMHAGARVVHLEAGLRSFDADMLEERHRRAVDHIAHELLTYTDRQTLQLEMESARGRVTRVGNPMVDVTHELMSAVDARAVTWPQKPWEFVYVTMHRKEFTDHPSRMADVFSAIQAASALLKLEVVYPVHPRTKDCAHRAHIDWPFKPCPPVDLVESLARVQFAALVVTDSGGIQEEGAIYGTPCVTIRENTERPETVDAGVNVVTGFDSSVIVDAMIAAKEKPRKPSDLYGPLGVGQRVVDVLQNHG